MSNRKAEIRSFIEECHNVSWPTLESLTAKDAGEMLYQDGDQQWNVHNLVAHLADAEGGMLGQAKRAASGEVTVPENFDLERWNRGVARKSTATSIPEFLNQIQEAHLACLKFLEDLDDSQLDMQGRHASGDILTIEGFLRRIAQHRKEHVQDLSGVLEH